ncbi:hypothetical protein PM082_013112 [Marasmius tenuissimus]|nr:hypothetical protein PM082_013112 [Marasmius tenuissimus]
MLKRTRFQNPLHFSFPPDVDEESLMQGAEQLSQAILHSGIVSFKSMISPTYRDPSDPLLVRANQDLTSQLKGRKERLSWLIQFINDNLVLLKMSQSCRQHLLMDAEKLSAALDLWSQHNELLAEAPTHSVLNDAVYLFMSGSAEGQQDDYMRAFFRTHIGVLGNLVQKVPDITLNAAQETAKSVADLLPEANNILLVRRATFERYTRLIVWQTVLNSAFRHREDHLGLYDIQLPVIKPWTSEQEIIDGVLALFDTSTRVVESSPERGPVGPTDLSELATVLFICIQERLEWLDVAGQEAVSLKREYEELKSKFDHLRPEVLETLRRFSSKLPCREKADAVLVGRNGQAERAFSLAEQYRDFSSLAALCHRETVFPPEENPNAARIQTYVDHFKEEFTTELYRWYIQHGELRVMFAQEATHKEYLDKYFSENPNPGISWLQDLGNRRYAGAASALHTVATHEVNLETKHLMLSLGKLSQLAHLQESEDAEDGGLLDAFHDDLDFVSVHESLLEEFKVVLSKLRGKKSLDTQVETILRERAMTLADRNELVLLPEARKISAFRTVWRRIYIHDDWDAIRKTTNVSDAELQKRFKNTALYNTLLETLPREDDQEGYETVPDVALIIPSVEEIASRWPGMPQDQIERLIQDYNLECDKLGDMDLNDVYHRVRELAVEDLTGQEP